MSNILQQFHPLTSASHQQHIQQIRTRLHHLAYNTKQTDTRTLRVTNLNTNLHVPVRDRTFLSGSTNLHKSNAIIIFLLTVLFAN